MDHEQVVEWVNDRIVDRPGTVIVAFLAVTLVFATGLGSVQSESGQEQFIEDLPSFQALEDVQRDFGATFDRPTTTTTVVQESSNVLGKAALIGMLEAQERVVEGSRLRVVDTSSPAQVVARTLDPDATTLDAQIEAVERATPAQIDRAVREAARRPTFVGDLSDDFNRRSATATAARATFTHAAGRGSAEGGGGGPGSAEEFPPNRADRVRSLVATTPGMRVVGTAPNTIDDSLLLVLPAAILFITLFLAVAYRDPVDFLLGLVSIAVTLVWTFGFLGLFGIPISVLVVAVPPLLIAIGIDFGIHAVNRYREERVEGSGVEASMRATTHQIGVAFLIVMGTSAIGFLSNLASAFPPTRDFGVAAAVGVVFTTLIFGVFLPAQKVLVDRLREAYPVPTLSRTPIGSESSPLGRLLAVGVPVAERAPELFLAVLLVTTAGAGVYATGVDTGFSPDDFLPAEETPDYLQVLPEPFRPPAEFEHVKHTNFVDEHFEEDGQVLLLVERPMERDEALERIYRANADPPSTFRRDGWRARAESIVTVIRARAASDPAFRRLVSRNDRDGNGVPDENLDRIYDALESGPTADRVDQFLSEDRRSTRIVYAVDADAADDVVTADAREVADRFDGRATPTGTVVIFDEALGLVLDSVFQTLVITLVGASAFLVLVFWALEGDPWLGVANVVPIAVTVVALVATMRALGIAFNAVNGVILAITIGLGIDYSVHVVHRFADEFDGTNLGRALRRTVVGTGGALTGSMLTTVFGVGVIALALNPALGVFGLLTALSVFYAYLVSVFVLPSVLAVRVKLGEGPIARAGAGAGA